MQLVERRPHLCVSVCVSLGAHAVCVGIPMSKCVIFAYVRKALGHACRTPLKLVVLPVPFLPPFPTPFYAVAMAMVIVVVVAVAVSVALALPFAPLAAVFVALVGPL